jgi:hypothetical protein
MRGRWAAGIVPRNFCWIIKDHLAVSERPGGYAPNHRKVRRQEELLWLRAQGFTRVVSLLGSTHNLHAYEELGLEWSRFPMPVPSETPIVLAKLYPAMHGWLRGGERLLLHQEELGDCVMGVAAGYLLWSEILPDGPRAITAMEQLLRRQMGTVGRMIVAAVDEVPPVRSLAWNGAPVATGDSDKDGAVAETKRFEVVVSIPDPDNEGELSQESSDAAGEVAGDVLPRSTAGPADEPSDAGQVQPAQTEPVQVQPVQVQPVQVEAAQTEPAQTEPLQVEAAQTEPVQAEAAQTEPLQVEPLQVEAAHTGPRAEAVPTRADAAHEDGGRDVRQGGQQ